MTRSKLSEVEKREIIDLFLQGQETIAGLAEQFQVSGSTIRRLVKVATEAETASEPELAESGLSEAPSLTVATPRLSSVAQPEVVSSRPQRDRPRKRNAEVAVDDDIAGESRFSAEPNYGYDALDMGTDAPLGEILAEIDQDLQADLATRRDLDEEDEDEEDALAGFDDEFEEGDDDLEDGEDAEISVKEVLGFSATQRVEVLPIAEAMLPRTCYVVVDRMAELVTRPLRDFGDLGQIPSAEVQANTLPVFDNHRIARRFSHRAQRIVKVPNGNVFKKANAQLTAKGITRLLVNGQIYAL